MTAPREYGVVDAGGMEATYDVVLFGRRIGDQFGGNQEHGDRAVPDQLRIRMFGALTIGDGADARHGRSIGAVKTRALLELLLLARGRPISKDELVHALWEGRSSLPRDPFRTLEHYVCVLRAALGRDGDGTQSIVTTGPNCYRLQLDRVDLDVERFDRAMRAAETADHDKRRALLTMAVGLAGGDLLEDSTIPAWSALERDRYRELVARANLWLAEDALHAGDLHATLLRCDEALRHTPFSEHAFRLQMVANRGLGCDDIARSCYHRCRHVLARGLNLDPTSHTDAIASAVDAGASFEELLVMLTHRAA